MKLIVRELKTFMVTHTTEDGTRISDAQAMKAVGEVTKGEMSPRSAEEVQVADDFKLWKIVAEVQHFVDV
jgi:hypothetical protein